MKDDNFSEAHTRFYVSI